MSFQKSDIGVVPQVFTPFVQEQMTLNDAFIQSGVVKQLPELNLSAERGGDFVKIPFYKANLDNLDFEVLSDSKSLTPGKIQTSAQIAPVLHRGRAFSARDLASLAVGSDTDPMAVIGSQLARYINHQKQKSLFNILTGIFGGSVNDVTENTGALATMQLDGNADAASGNKTPKATLGASHVTRAKALLGDQGDKLTAICMHSHCYYDLMNQRAVDFVYTNEGITDATYKGGSVAKAFDPDIKTPIPTFMGLRIIVSDDVPKAVAAPNTEYSVFFFTEGAIVTGEQAPLRTQTDRDILALEEAIAIDLHYLYHPVGCSYKSSITNPAPDILEDDGSWELVYNEKNIGIIRATVKSATD